MKWGNGFSQKKVDKIRKIQYSKKNIYNLLRTHNPQLTTPFTIHYLLFTSVCHSRPARETISFLLFFATTRNPFLITQNFHLAPLHRCWASLTAQNLHSHPERQRRISIFYSLLFIYLSILSILLLPIYREKWWILSLLKKQNKILYDGPL